MVRIGLKAIVVFLCAFVAQVEGYVFFAPEMMGSHVKSYTPEERDGLERDLKVIREVCFFGTKEVEGKKPLYVSTAGAPGARKTTILERFLKGHPEEGGYVYVDPDQRALRFMVHTYYSQALSAASISQYEHYIAAERAAYDKWRGASNYITLVLLEEAFAQKRNIAHGATSTGDHIGKFLTEVKKAGYETVLLLCSCEDEFRKKAIEYRIQEQRFFQSTPEDVVSKGKIFPQRMAAYFTHADQLYLYWSDELTLPERLTAIFKNGRLELIDTSAYQRFVHKYENDRRILAGEGKQLPSWDEIMALYQARYS